MVLSPLKSMATDFQIQMKTFCIVKSVSSPPVLVKGLRILVLVEHSSYSTCLNRKVEQLT